MGKLGKITALEFESIPKLLWSYFLPAFAGVIINSLYNIVDRIFIGQYVDALALAGLSAIFPIMIIMMAFGMLVGMGAGVRISINLGKKDYSRAELVLGNAFIMMIIVSVLITVIGFTISHPLLQFFGVNEQTYTYAQEYLHIILMGTVFNILGYGLNNLIRSEGSAQIAMISMLISAGLNILLDYIFIVRLQMGVKGAAYATVLSQVALTTWVIAHFKSSRSVIQLRARSLKLTRNVVWYIVSIGFAPFSMQIASSAVFGIYNIQLIKYGSDMAIGAMGVIISISMLMVMTVISITMANQPIIGFNIGAKNYKRVKETLRISIIAATVISIAGFAIAQLMPGAIIKLFNNKDAELLRIGTQGLRIFLMVLPLIGFQIVIGNYYQSIGKAGISAFLSVLRQVIFLIPLLFVLPNYFGLAGVWLSAPVSDTMSACVCVFFTVYEFRKLNKAIALQTP
ncbi:putative efflux protein, MATE family [Saccharicrinis carchari]|uniref:Multidrug export protein MepA n=1 Tax=Saccharicrinis carchari TaxID=1168039 RepID=A0A521AJB1_SACCC|nr:MATE family efflux transporter [Saccharicrinis carchari]SMO34858.1 putative efflux protein, MATE family [Saccharicrinis carchari]